jgi:hypothetical protein
MTEPNWQKFFETIVSKELKQRKQHKKEDVHFKIEKDSSSLCELIPDVLKRIIEFASAPLSNDHKASSLSDSKNTREELQLQLQLQCSWHTIEIEIKHSYSELFKKDIATMSSLYYLELAGILLLRKKLLPTLKTDKMHKIKWNKIHSSLQAWLQEW